MVQTKAEDASEKSLARRREIVFEASKCFREKGFHATGMRDLAARLGMTVGNLYYYFRNKEELLRFCQEDTLARLDRLVAWVRGQDLGADSRLLLLVTGHVICLHQGAWGSLAHLEVPEADGPENRALIERRRGYEGALEEVVREGLRDGVFRDVEPRLPVMAILGSVNWTVRWFDPEGPRSAREVGEAFALQLVRGLLAPGREIEIPEVAWPDFGAGDRDPQDGQDG